MPFLNMKKKYVVKCVIISYSIIRAMKKKWKDVIAIEHLHQFN